MKSHYNIITIRISCPFFFLEKLYKADEKEFDEITSFFRTPTLYFIFFNKPTRAGINGNINYQQPSDPGTHEIENLLL